MVVPAVSVHDRLFECLRIAGDHFAFFEDKIGGVGPLFRRRKQVGVQDELQVFPVLYQFFAPPRPAPLPVPTHWL